MTNTNTNNTTTQETLRRIAEGFKNEIITKDEKRRNGIKLEFNLFNKQMNYLRNYYKNDDDVFYNIKLIELKELRNHFSSAIRLYENITSKELKEELKEDYKTSIQKLEYLNNIIKYRVENGETSLAQYKKYNN